ncbi:MAG: NUDIX domain-containing protein [Thermomicrobiales bacterium]
MQQLPKREGALAILVNEAGQILLQLRDDDPTIPYPATWGLPGGGIEPGETSELAVRRELIEEIAFVAGDLAELGRFVTPEGFVLNVFSGAIDLPLEALELNEGTALCFFPPQALRELHIAPWLKAVLLRHLLGDAAQG